MSYPLQTFHTLVTVWNCRNYMVPRTPRGLWGLVTACWTNPRYRDLRVKWGYVNADTSFDKCFSPNFQPVVLWTSLGRGCWTCLSWRHRLRDLCVEGRQVLKLTLKKSGVIGWIRFVSFRTVSIGSVLIVMVNLCFSWPVPDTHLSSFKKHFSPWW